MTRSRSTAIFLAISIGCILAAGPAASDHHESPDSALGEEKAAEKTAMEAWGDQNPWRYNTDYLFLLTRGLEDAGVERPWARFGLYVLTVPLDIADLPFSALGGLFGD